MPDRERTDPWRSRIVRHGEEAPDQLLASPFNWRIHPKAQQDAIEGALDEIGWIQNVIVNERSGHVIDGHARIAIAITRGEASVPVVYVDLDENEERVALLSLDPLAAMAMRDQRLLDELVAQTAVTDSALQEMLSGLASPPEIEPPEPEDPVLYDPPPPAALTLSVTCPSCGTDFDVPTRRRAE